MGIFLCGMNKCGAACITMIASHFGRRISIAEVSDYAGTDIIGTNINDPFMPLTGADINLHEYKKNVKKKNDGKWIIS